jgi:hypothetical protein
MSAEPEKKEGAGSDIMKAIRIEKLVVNCCVGESGDRLTRAAKVHAYTHKHTHNESVCTHIYTHIYTHAQANYMHTKKHAHTSARTRTLMS